MRIYNKEVCGLYFTPKYHSAGANQAACVGWDMHHVWGIGVVYTGFGGETLQKEGVNGRVILKWILEELDGERDGLARFGSGQGQVADYCECCNEPPGFIKCVEFLD